MVANSVASMVMASLSGGAKILLLSINHACAPLIRSRNKIACLLFKLANTFGEDHKAEMKDIYYCAQDDMKWMD